MNINEQIADYIASNIISLPYSGIRDLAVVFNRVSLSNELHKNKLLAIHNKVTFIAVCDLFNENNISYIAFKGMILSILIYQDYSTRPVGDIDIYVEAADYDRAIAILESIGFSPLNNTNNKSLHHVGFQRNSIIIELHRYIMERSMGISELSLRVFAKM